MEKTKRNNKPDTAFCVGNVWVGRYFFVIAGPCAVESEHQIVKCAQLAKAQGASMLRGGAFKPRTSPYDFQGLEEEGLRYLQTAKQETNLPIVTEIVDSAHISLFEKYDIDVYQIGSRNSQNFKLLEAVGKANKTVLLKRGMSMTLDEYLNSAEYFLANGSTNVILCERGIRTVNDKKDCRNTADVGAIVRLRQYTHLPVIADPSHATGYSDMVMPVARSYVAAGAQGLIVEMHYDPKNSRCDGTQSVQRIDNIVRSCSQLYSVINEKVA